MRWSVVVLALLVVLVVGGPQYAVWSGEPVAAKDCVVSPVDPLPAEGLSRTSARAGAAAYAGGLAQQGGTVTDASCLTRTPVYGVARPRDEGEVRTALAFAQEHDLVVSVGGTQHALGGQASYPGGLVVDMRGLDAVTVDEGERTAVVQAGATWHQVLEAVHTRSACRWPPCRAWTCSASGARSRSTRTGWTSARGACRRRSARCG
ncbi:FAD-binding oxidoreductase [Ornithinimicrobium sp. W1665]|uniref:FAD-binding oxidoreductase n=1 Tax=Ornithinimicrobium sp. W1665 TaxID=3416666 RepID=UPI003D6B9A7F